MQAYYHELEALAEWCVYPFWWLAPALNTPCMNFATPWGTPVQQCGLVTGHDVGSAQVDENQSRVIPGDDAPSSWETMQGTVGITSTITRDSMTAHCMVRSHERLAEGRRRCPLCVQAAAHVSSGPALTAAATHVGAF